MPDLRFELTVADEARGPFTARGRSARVELALEGDAADLLNLLAAAGDELTRLLGAAAVALQTTSAESVTVSAPDPREEPADDEMEALAQEGPDR